MKNLWMPCAQFRRTRSSTSSAERKRDLRPCTLMMVQNEHWYGQPRPASKTRAQALAYARHIASAGMARVCHLWRAESFMKLYKRREAFGGGVAQHLVEIRSSASPANMEMPISRHASSSTARPSSIDRHPDTWKPPMATWIPAARNGRAMSSARGYWFDWTPTRPTKSESYRWRRKTRRAGPGTSMWVLVSSITSMSMATSGPTPAARRNPPRCRKLRRAYSRGSSRATSGSRIRRRRNVMV